MTIYTFHGGGRVFGFTPDQSGSNLPNQWGNWTAFKTIELTRGQNSNPNVKTDECLDDIEAFGYHITDAHVRVPPPGSPKE